MPKVTEEHRLAKHEAIVDAALRAFARKGFQATSVAEIIAESGMSAGAIYGSFGSKEEIVRDVATRVVSARLTDLENLGARDRMPDPGAMVETVIRTLATTPGWPSILTQVWGEAVTDPALRAVSSDILSQIRRGFVVYLTRWHQQAHGLTPREAAELAADQAPLLLSAVHGFVVQDSLSDDFDRERYLSRTLALLPR